MSSSTRIASLRHAFFSGLLLVAPLVVTVWAFGKVVDVVGGNFRALFFFYVPDEYLNAPRLVLLWDILGTAIAIILITLLGYVSRYVLGKFFLQAGERFLEGIPGVRPVYKTVKQIISTFSAQKRDLFNKVVLVQFPHEGVWSMGFLTSRETGEIGHRLGGELRAVFIPTTPNPTSGFLIFLPADKVIELEMPVSEGMKMIISGGTVLPPWPAAANPIAR
jgi:uncharacterized membrane protein